MTPKDILDISWNHAKSRVLFTAIELDIFTCIAQGKHTPEDIAGAATASSRGVRMLLDALTVLKLVSKPKPGFYRLTSVALKFLVRGTPAYLGGLLKHSSRLTSAWSHLTDVVKSGRPVINVEDAKNAEEYFSELVSGLFAINYPMAIAAAKCLKSKKITSILDVAAGSGVWGIGAAKVFPKAKITVLDFPRILGIARSFIARHNLSERYSFIEGDLRKVDLGREKYDLILLGHICHSEGAAHSQALIKKSFSALKAKGALIIADFIPDDLRKSELMPILFALNMLLQTQKGDTFTKHEYFSWLRAAGFKKMKLLTKIPAQSPLILAEK